MEEKVGWFYSFPLEASLSKPDLSILLGEICAWNKIVYSFSTVSITHSFIFTSILNMIYEVYSVLISQYYLTQLILYTIPPILNLFQWLEHVPCFVRNCCSLLCLTENLPDAGIEFNQVSPHCRKILYHVSHHQGAPFTSLAFTYPLGPCLNHHFL